MGHCHFPSVKSGLTNMEIPPAHSHGLFLYGSTIGTWVFIEPQPPHPSSFTCTKILSIGEWRVRVPLCLFSSEKGGTIEAATYSQFNGKNTVHFRCHVLQHTWCYELSTRQQKYKNIRNSGWPVLKRRGRTSSQCSRIRMHIVNIFHLHPRSPWRTENR